MDKLRYITKATSRICHSLLINRHSTVSLPRRHFSNLYEPDYLISLEPDHPVHDCLNIQLKGYDYALLESCQGNIHRYAEVMGLEVDECWATPAQHLKVQKFKPASTVVDTEYQLNVYERNIQLNDVPAYALGNIIRVTRALLPQGCSVSVHDHTPEHEEIRYVPDNQLLELKQQLGDMDTEKVVSKKKRK